VRVGHKVEGDDQGRHRGEIWRREKLRLDLREGGGTGQIRTRWKAALEEEERDGGGARERDGGVEKGQ
jgi:hypothetical protein